MCASIYVTSLKNNNNNNDYIVTRGGGVSLRAESHTIKTMSQTDELASSMKDKEMSTSKNSSSLRLNQEGGGGGSGGVSGIGERSECWQDHDSDSEISENDFLTKGAFLLTPSHELSMEKAATICEKMNFR